MAIVRPILSKSKEVIKVNRSRRVMESLRKTLLYRGLRFLAPDGRLTYAFAGEDQLASFFFRDIRNGYYVDVGCAHPRQISSTYLFYQRGWRGIGIDPNAEYSPLWLKYRPHDVYVNSAISDNDGIANYQVYANPEYNSIVDGHVAQPLTPSRQPPRLLERRQLQVQRLSNVLERFEVKKNFELLSIDVEGAELSVLRGLDFTRWQPQLMVIEMLEFDVFNPQCSEVVSFCRDAGYAFRGYIIQNAYFQKIQTSGG